MPKLTRAEVETNIAEWSRIQGQIAKLEEKKAEETAGFQKKFDAGVKAIDEHYDPKISRLQSCAADIESAIRGWLEKQKRNVSIETKKAIASVEHASALQARVINVKKFLGYVKAKGDAVYDCVTVAVAKAEKVLGKEELDKISERPTKPVVTVTLQLKD